MILIKLNLNNLDLWRKGKNLNWLSVNNLKNNIKTMSYGSVKDILKDKKKVRFVAESAFK